MSGTKRYIKKNLFLICAFAAAVITVFSVCCTDTYAADVSNKMYTISKGAGTYNAPVTVKVKAKKGYKVYYCAGGKKFSVKKVINSGKSKKITISSTTTLRLYAVKKSKTMTNKLLRTAKTTKKATSYKYTISISSDTGNDDTTVTPTGTPTSSPTTAPEVTAAPSPAGTQPADAPTGAPQPSGIPTGGPVPSGVPTGGPIPSGVPTGGPQPSASPQPTETQQAEVPDNSDAYIETDTPAGDDAAYDGEGTVFETILLTDLAALDKKTTTDTYTFKPASDDGAGNITPASLKFTQISEETGSDDPQQSGEGDTDATPSNTAYAYELTGSLENVEIKFDKAITEPVILKLNNVTIDNSAITSNEPVIQFSKNSSSATLIAEGVNSITGAGGFDNSYIEDDGPGEPAPVIKYSNAAATLLVTGSEGSVLNIIDAMSEDTSYLSYSSADSAQPDASVDPSDGISVKGAVVVDTDGSLNISVNGSALKGKGEENAVDDSFTGYKSGGVTVKSGTITLTSRLDKGISSKYGLITIAGGQTTINSEDDGINAKYYKAQITGGKLTVEDTRGDGIQSENIVITGGETDIKTSYKYAATNFYKTNFTGKINSETENEGTGLKTETVNYDTGSHKALKAGSKAETSIYTAVSEGSSLTAGSEYTQEASGGITITGGTINLDTTAAGIKYNGGSSAGMGGDSKTIIGSPDDAFHSNNTAVISGGTIVINSSDDGISSVNSLEITGNASVRVETAYEGIESGSIVIGSTEDENSDPTVYVYSNDDGINASKKTDVTYTYADESEETYVKTSVKGSDNNLYICSGSVHVEIADDVTRSVTLKGNAADGSGSQTVTYTADGDGIDCNGSFYAYGGTIEVIGGTGNGNSAIDRDGSFVMGSGVTLFALGSSGMIEGVTQAQQPYITSASSSGFGQGGFGPGGSGQGNTSSFLVSAGDSVTVSDGSSQLYSYAQAKKSASYILFSSPELTEGQSYVISAGTDQTTLSATTQASSGGGMTPPGMNR